MLKIQSSLIVLWHFAQFNILAIHEFFFWIWTSAQFERETGSEHLYKHYSALA